MENGWRSGTLIPTKYRKGFWFALTCVCSLYVFLKALLIFHNSK